MMFINKKLTYMAIVLAACFMFRIAYATQDLDKAKEEKKNIDSEIIRVGQDRKDALSEKDRLERERNALLEAEKAENEEFKRLVDEIEELEGVLEAVKEAVRQAEEAYEKQYDDFQCHLRAMYKNSTDTVFDILLQSKNITDFLERFELIRALSVREKQMLDELELARQDVEFKKANHLEQKVELQGLIDSKRDHINSLVASRSMVSSQIQSSRSKIASLEQQERELLAKSEEMSNLIQVLSTRKNYVEGEMVWPLPSSSLITSPYGNRLHPILRIYSIHTGIDIAGKSGANILSANTGTVIVSGWQNAYGNTVVVDHGGGITTLYAHMSKIIVSKGDEVSAGDIIGRVGSTGWSTGPHLHFEVRVDGKTKNPLEYVKN